MHGDKRRHIWGSSVTVQGSRLSLGICAPRRPCVFHCCYRAEQTATVLLHKAGLQVLHKLVLAHAQFDILVGGVAPRGCFHKLQSRVRRCQPLCLPRQRTARRWQSFSKPPFYPSEELQSVGSPSGHPSAAVQGVGSSFCLAFHSSARRWQSFCIPFYTSARCWQSFCLPFYRTARRWQSSRNRFFTFQNECKALAVLLFTLLQQCRRWQSFCYLSFPGEDVQGIGSPSATTIFTILKKCKALEVLLQPLVFTLSKEVKAL